jgi:transcription-repair coupling factor (superfamily II helicase)
VIATAPQRRLAIKTFVRSENDGVIREAVLRELKRGGQVYFLHNEVETIENRRERSRELLPEARIAVAHGQMPERELERVMRDFVASSATTCCCAPPSSRPASTCPTANTIVINRADTLRPGAAAPAARARRPLAPPGLCLPARARTCRA